MTKVIGSMELNLSPKYGGKPQFTPAFVEVVVRVVRSHGGDLDLKELLKLIYASDHEEFIDFIRFGTNFGFWKFSNDEVISVEGLNDFSEETWTPSRFAEFIHHSVFAKNLEKHENWNTIAALLVWAHSLKISYHNPENQKKMPIQTDWKSVEKFAAETGLFPDITRNAEQWGISKLWLLKSGLFLISSNSFSPSTFFLCDQFRKSLKKFETKWIPIRELIEEVRNLCPYLPGGKYGKVWTSYLKDKYPVGFPQAVDMESGIDLTQQESFAILLLEGRDIVLKSADDAADRLKLILGTPGKTEARMVSHFKRESLS